MTGFSGFNMSNPIEVPDISQLDKWDQLHEQAIQSLEISADGLFVKCQRCQKDVRMVPKGLGLVRSGGDRIVLLERQIKHIEYLHRKNRISDIEYNRSIREMNE